MLTEKKLSQTVTANATSGEIRLGYQVELPDSGSVTLPVYCQPKFNAVRDSTENSSRLSGLGVVVAPHFFVSGTDVSNRDVTTGPPLGLKGKANSNDLIRIEVHATKGDDNEIAKIKWARANASTVFSIKKIEGRKLTFFEDCSFLKSSSYAEFEFANGATLGCKLFRVLDAQGKSAMIEDDPPEAIQTALDLLKDRNSHVFVRIWDDVADSLSAVKIDALQVDFQPESFEHFMPGDYWQLFLRKGEIIVASKLLNDGGTPISTEKNLSVNKDGEVSITAPVPISGGNRMILPHDSNRDAYVNFNRPSPSPTPRSVLAAPANSLEVDPKTLAVSRWLASMKLEEIATLSKLQMRERIKNACAESEYEMESLESDIDSILERRSLLLGLSGLVQSSLT